MTANTPKTEINVSSENQNKLLKGIKNNTVPTDPYFVMLTCVPYYISLVKYQWKTYVCIHHIHNLVLLQHFYQPLKNRI